MTIPGSANPLLSISAAGGGYEIERSLRFNSADSAYLKRTPGSAGNRKTWTLSFWVKRGAPTGSDIGLFSTYSGSNPATACSFNSNDGITFYNYSGSYQFQLITTQVFRDYSAWYHFVFSVDTTQATSSNRVKIYVNGNQITTFSTETYPSQNIDTDWNSTTEHQIGNHASYLTGYLADIHFIDGQALDPTSFGEPDTNGVWQPKAYAGSYGTNGFHLPFSDNSTAAALGTDTSGNGNTWTVNNLSVPVTSVTNPVWYASPNLYTTKADVLANATNKGTGSWGASNEYVYLVVNSGGNIGSSNVFGGNFPTTFYPYSNVGGTFTREGSYGATELSSFGWAATNSALYKIANDRDFYILSDTDANPPTGGSLSGTIPALTTSSFRTLAGINAAADSFVDSPTNYGEDTGAGGEVRGNYATLNPLDRASIGTLSNGNLKWVGDGTGNYCNTRGTLALTGKVYFEAVINAASVACSIGVAPGTDYNKAITDTAATDYFGSSAWGVNSAVIGGAFGTCYSNGASAGSFTGANSDILMCAFDQATGKIWFGRNGSWLLSGNPATGSNPTFTIANTLTVYPASTVRGTDDLDVNFGQRPFAYTAPSGFKALCTTNLAEPTIADGSTAMDVALYTGNGSTQTISGLNFSPDFVWTKQRGPESDYGHRLADIVRGTGKVLYSNNTSPEVSETGITAFNSDGYDLGSAEGLNKDSSSFVAWTWDAGSTTVTNTEGSITSQVRANASAGFSVVTYTGDGTAGATVGHGLGVKSGMIILKYRSTTSAWWVKHLSINEADQHLQLNSTIGAITSSNNDPFNGSLGTSTTFVVGSTDSARYGNGNGTTISAYCFAPVAGYSAFGSYTGNGSADGPFVYTGFRPRWLLLKNSTQTGTNWLVVDSARNTYNPTNLDLLANSSAPENNYTPQIDFLSNGFKFKQANSNYNSSSENFIYAAFAESPFAYARAR